MDIILHKIIKSMCVSNFEHFELESNNVKIFIIMKELIVDQINFFIIIGFFKNKSLDILIEIKIC